MERNKSFVKFFPEDDGGSHCGYCQSFGSRSHGMWAYDLNVNDYQGLINRGWRRSGQYCYKAIMNLTCCPLYTIRCEALNFHLSRSQKRVLKKFQRFILTGDKPKSKTIQEKRPIEVPFSISKKHLDFEQETSTSGVYLNTHSDSWIPKLENKPANITNASSVIFPNLLDNIDELKVSQKAKHKRICRRYETLKQRGLTDLEIREKMLAKKTKPVRRNLEELLDYSKEKMPVNKLDVRLVRSNPPADEFLSTFDSEFEVYRKYQMTIHKDPPEKVTPKSFERFLVNSPLVAEGPYGSFHQQYWLNSILIAVMVIDILPNCLSSVYSFYDPEYSFLTLGTYGALREIALTRQMFNTLPNLRYYYMGFYVHSCPKMRYKSSFRPCDLLCPETRTWHSITKCLPKLDVASYSRFHEGNDGNDGNEEHLDINQILVVHKRSILRFRDIPKSVARELTALLQLYASLVGQTRAQQMILVL